MILAALLLEIPCMLNSKIRKAQRIIMELLDSSQDINAHSDDNNPSMHNKKCSREIVRQKIITLSYLATKMVLEWRLSIKQQNNMIVTNAYLTLLALLSSK
jgi:hypothetical protein